MGIAGWSGTRSASRHIKRADLAISTRRRNCNIDLWLGISNAIYLCRRDRLDTELWDMNLIQPLDYEVEMDVNGSRLLGTETKTCFQQLLLGL